MVKEGNRSGESNNWILSKILNVKNLFFKKNRLVIVCICLTRGVKLLEGVALLE